MTEKSCKVHGPYYATHGRCPHRHCGDDRPDRDHTTCVPGSYSNDTKVRTHRGPAFVDPCIADIVEALNTAGIPTSASCCGHGDEDGSIHLSDGRTLNISFDQ